LALEAGGKVLFALLDGHGGDACRLLLQEALKARVNAIAEACASGEGLSDIFVAIDAELQARLPRSSVSGCSCLLALERADGALVLSHVGDSRAVLCDAGTGLLQGGRCLIADHSPDREDEAFRIRRAGQEITRARGVARINGGLSLSRCFGAFDYKASGAVTASPELVVLDWPPACLLVLYSSAVSEGCTDEEVARAATRAWRSTDDSALSACAVCDLAARAGSRRDASCLVIARRKP
jgi:serine/threonine protein phosphatase PrpC